MTPIIHDGCSVLQIKGTTIERDLAQQTAGICIQKGCGNKLGKKSILV